MAFLLAALCRRNIQKAIAASITVPTPTPTPNPTSAPADRWPCPELPETLCVAEFVEAAEGAFDAVSVD